MSRLVVLKLDGNSQKQGFRVTLAIGNEGEPPSVEMTGALPPAPELASQLQRHWQENYRNLAGERRIQPIGITYGGSINQRIAECRESASVLRDRLTAWLDSQEFRNIDRRLREELSRHEPIRILLCTEDRYLCKLPWHLWEFVERYPQAEVALSAPAFETVDPPPPPDKDKVRILAILGNSQGIDIRADREELAALPDVEIEFLVEPSREQLNDRLWEQSWDILFFAGHSQTEEEKGRIYINPQDSLTIEELKFGLRQAIAKGLQLAIFNSCDGLGLAYELEQLHLPQMIVMREPVPDKVAQAFLTHFLKAFARGDSLYLAERQARERLQGLEGNFPCASWLPAIYQNPSAVPPNWQTLKGGIPEPAAERRRMPLSGAFFASLAVTLVVMGVRSLGFLQPLELWGFDRLMGQRPPEAIDPRLLVVEVTEADVGEYNYPLEDVTLARVITQLEQHEPRAIGIDMHRHQPRGEGRDALLHRFAQNQNLFLVCAYGSSDKNYAPPPEFSQQQIANQVGFSDLIVDSFSGQSTKIRGDLVVGEQSETESRVVRRQLLSYDPSLSPAPSTCITPYSFSLQLAFQYLYQGGVEPLTVNDEQQWQFGDVAFQPLTSRFGGYQQLNGAIEQIAINYRSNQPGQKVTLRQILEGNIEEDFIKNRVILIGYTAPVARDNFNTPYGKMPGVWIHAHMVSQLLSAVEEGRPLIWVLPQWGDALWVLAWSVVGGLLAWALKARSPVYLVLASAIALFVLYQLCLFVLVQGGWMPLVPSALALVMVSGLVVIYPAIKPRKVLVSKLSLGTKSAGLTS